MNVREEKRSLRRRGGLLRMAGLALCLCCAPLPAPAGQDIVWNGAGAPGTTGELRFDFRGATSLYPDGPSGNSVTVNADVPDFVYGGLSSYSDSSPAAAAGNSAVINGGSVDNNVYGGYALSRSGSGTATGNRATINGGSVDNDVYGGYAQSDSGPAAATGNRAVINGGSVDNNVYGGAVLKSLYTTMGTATATANSVFINGGSVGNDVSGGYAGSNLGTAAVAGNRATINGGSVDNDVYGGYAYSRSGTVAATGNSVTINRGSVGSNVHGGYVEGSGTATATGNSVTVNGGSIMNNVYGGRGKGSAGNLGTITAAGNSVVINGGTVEQDVYGGHVYNDTGTAAATGNSVVITGGSIKQDVMGGFTNGAADRVTDNTITLSDAPVFGPASGLYGGRPTTGDAFTGNTLNVWNYTGSAVNSVRNFQHYSFVLPAAMRNGATLLTVTGTAWFDDSQSMTSSGARSLVSGLNIMGGGAALQTGDSVTLMRYGTLGNNAVAVNGNGLIQGRKGVSLLYDFQLSQTATELSATVARVQAHPQAKALSEGRVAGLAFVNQGGDLLAGTGMDAARRAAAAGLAPFLAFQGGAARYDTGSHVDVDGFSLMTGLAWSKTSPYGHLLLGAFFESGWGGYDSHNSFSNFASVKGDGDTNYYGGGLLGRFDFTDTGPGHVYAEASFRAGWADTDFSSSDFREPFLNRKASYDSGSAYHGAHAGLGYVWDISERSNLDTYARYFWTHQDGNSVEVADDPIHFKAVDSRRLRAGARFSRSLLTDSGLMFTPYVGAAWEHEFDGRAGATAYGYDLDAPDLKGNTGIGELGVSFRPSGVSGLSLEVAVQGFTGVREGVSGGLQAKWEF